jgi:hypothetical protein
MARRDPASIRNRYDWSTMMMRFKQIGVWDRLPAALKNKARGAEELAG